MKKIILFLFFLISGCASTVNVDKNTYPHMILLDKNGETFVLKQVNNNSNEVDNKHTNSAADPVADNDLEIEERLTKHLKAIEENLKYFLEANHNVADAQHIQKEVILYIHGGLISKEESSRASTELHNAILDDNASCIANSKNFTQKNPCNVIYPIFINWESGMGAAYLDHLFNIRQGKEAKYIGPLTSPFYFIADVGRAITRLPVTLTYQGYDAVRELDVASDDYINSFNQAFCQNNTKVSLGKNKRSQVGSFADKATYVFPGVFKIVTTPIVDVVGRSGWDNMLRRTKAVFRRPDDYKGSLGAHDECHKKNDALDRLNNIDFKLSDPCIHKLIIKQDMGGVSRLLTTLNKVLGQNKKLKPTLTLIGHSMGTIISTHLLNKLLESNRYPNVHFNNIVFMAAASSIRQFEDNVIPYMQKHPQTEFFNLTLHPYNEENEQTGFDSLPRGSLLVWIDNYSASPDTIADLTFGKWNNAIRALPFVPKDIRGRISLKGFGVVGDESNSAGVNEPQIHAAFNDVKQSFWRKQYWLPVNGDLHKACVEQK